MEPVFSDKTPSLFAFEIKPYELSIYFPDTEERVSYFLLPEKSAFIIETKKDRKIVQVFIDYGTKKEEIFQSDVLRSAAKIHFFLQRDKKTDNPFIFQELSLTTTS